MLINPRITAQKQAFGRDIHESEIGALMQRDYSGLFHVAQNIGLGEIKKGDGAQKCLEESIYAQHCDFKHKPDAKYYVRNDNASDSFVQITQRLLDERRPPQKSIVLTKDDAKKFFAGFPKVIAQCGFNLGCRAYDPEQALSVIKEFNARNVLALPQSVKIFREFEGALKSAFDTEHPLKTFIGRVFRH